MKKILTLITVCIISISSLFAVEGFASAKFGANFSWYQNEYENYLGDDITKEVDSIHFDLGLDSATYFNSGDTQVGLGYGVAISFPYSQTIDGKDYQNDKPMLITPKVSIQMRHKLSKTIFFETGVGVNCAHSKQNVIESDSTKVVKKAQVLSVMANLGLQCKFNDVVGLRCGAEVTTPVYSSLKWEVSSISRKNEATTKGVAVVPYIGLALLY